MTIWIIGFLLFLQSGIPRQLPKGIVYAELKNDVTSRRSKLGQTVKMVVAEDATLEDGTTIPADAKLTGKLVVVQKHRNGQPAIVAFVPEKAQWKGHSLDLTGNLEMVELMSNESSGGGAMPYLRDNGGGGLAGAGETGSDTKLVPKDCAVGPAGDDAKTQGIVCKEREVEMGPGGRVYFKVATVSK